MMRTNFTGHINIFSSFAFLKRSTLFPHEICCMWYLELFTYFVSKISLAIMIVSLTSGMPPSPVAVEA
ncbi:MAG: hypothetical protein R3A12_19070 [Ignavibacteria bacterium]